MKRLILALLCAALLGLIAVAPAIPARGAYMLPYVAKVLSIQPTYLVGYWPLMDTSGTVAKDYGPLSGDGTYSGPALATMPLSDHLLAGFAPLFDGINDRVSLPKDVVQLAFDGRYGTISVWFKVANSGVWSDGVQRFIAFVYSDTTSAYLVIKKWSDNSIQVARNSDIVSGCGHAFNTTSLDWINVTFRWNEDNDTYTAFLNGSPSSGTCGGTWPNPRLYSYVGIGGTSSSDYWSGYIAHVAIWRTELTDDEVASLYDISPLNTPTPTPALEVIGTLPSGQGYSLQFSATGGDTLIVMILLVIVAILIFNIFLQVVKKR